MDPSVAELLTKVDKLGKQYLEKDGSNEQVRRNLRAMIAKLQIAVDTPGDIIDKYTYMVGRLPHLPLARLLRC